MNIPNKETTTFLLRNSRVISFVLCFFLFTTSNLLDAQDNELRFVKQPALEIIKAIEHKLDIKFNFIHKQLPIGNFTFSVFGENDTVISQVFNELDRDYELLEPAVYIIRENELPDEKKVEIPVYSGRVISSNGEPLAYCSIVLKDLGIGFETDEKGKFKFSKLLSPEEKVLFKYVGYTDKLISVKTLGTKEKTIVLEYEEHIMGEIIIKDFLRIRQSSELEDYDQINKNNSEVPGSGDKDIFQLAQTLPGIQSSSESLNDLQIRGGPPDQTAYKWNDIKLLQNSLFYGRISSVNPFMVDQIRISRNGASAAVSSQASGSIELEASNHVLKDVQTYLYSDLLHFNIGLGIPIIKDKLSLKCAFRNSHTQYLKSQYQENIFDQLFVISKLRDDEYYATNFDDDEQSQFTEFFKFNETSAALNYQVSDKTKAKFAFTNFGNTFQYQFDQKFWEEYLSQDTLNVETMGLSANLEHDFSKSIKVQLSANKSNFSNRYSFNNDVRAISNPSIRLIENKVENQQINLKLKYTHEYFDVDLGIQDENWNVTFVDSAIVKSAGWFYENNAVETYEHSAYLLTRLKLIPKTLIELGYRYSSFGEALLERKFLEPRLHLSYLHNESFKFHAHYGHYHQNLNRHDYSLPLDVEKGIWFVSDESIDSENFLWVVTNRQASVGFQYLKDNWKFTVDLFNKQINDIWTSALGFPVEEDPFKFSQLNAKGIEYAAQYENDRHKILFSYEYTDEKLRISEGDTLTYELNSPYTQRHRASLYQLVKWKNWSFGTRLKYATGRYYSADASLVYDEELEYYYTSYPQGLLNKKTPYYMGIDASVFYTQQIQNINQMKLGVHFVNLLNRDNVISRKSYADYTQSPVALFNANRPGIPFSWNLSFELTF